MKSIFIFGKGEEAFRMVSIQTESVESVLSLLQRKHLCMWSSEGGADESD